MTVPPLRIPRHFIEPMVRERISAKTRGRLKFPGKFLGKKDRLAAGQLRFLYPQPEEYDTYVEVCVGTGGSYRFLQSLGHLLGKRVVFIEKNENIVNLWHQIQTNPEGLRARWRTLTLDMSKAEFYRMRDECNYVLSDPVEKAVHLLYILRLCMNGVYRENSQGKCHSTKGDQKPKVIFDEEAIGYLHKAVQGVEIYCADATVIQQEEYAPAGSFVCADPPYTNTDFKSYGPEIFGPPQFHRFLGICQEVLSAREVKWMISNGFDINFIPEDVKREDFNCAGIFRPDTVNARRKKTARDGRRIPYFVPESVLRNYRTKRDGIFIRQAEVLRPLHALQKSLHEQRIPLQLAMETAAENFKQLALFLSSGLPADNLVQLIAAMTQLFSESVVDLAPLREIEGRGGQFMQGLQGVISAPYSGRIDLPGAFSDLAELNPPKDVILRKRIVEIFGGEDNVWTRFFLHPDRVCLAPIPKAASRIRITGMDPAKKEALLEEVKKVQKEKKPKGRVPRPGQLEMFTSGIPAVS